MSLFPGSNGILVDQIGKMKFTVELDEKPSKIRRFYCGFFIFPIWSGNAIFSLTLKKCDFPVWSGGGGGNNYRLFQKLSKVI